jgi:carboxymethylenebutenolidase
MRTAKRRPPGDTFRVISAEEPAEAVEMLRLDVQIPTADGHSNGTLHVPAGAGPWPGVLVFPDAGGARETFRRMGDRLAGLGYVALIPDIYYRAGDWAPFDVATLFTDTQERARLSGLAGPLTNDRVIADSASYADFLLARPEVAGAAIGTTGYCLGGRMSLIAAGGLGHTIEFYPARHGFAVPGNPTYDSQAAARHWDALGALYQAHLHLR